RGTAAGKDARHHQAADGRLDRAMAERLRGRRARGTRARDHRPRRLGQPRVHHDRAAIDGGATVARHPGLPARSGDAVIVTTAPNAIETVDALLVPRVAQALRVWRRLGLELGEAAVFTGRGDLADVVGLLAKWHGGMPVVRLTDTDAAPIDGIQDVAVQDAT